MGYMDNISARIAGKKEEAIDKIIASKMYHTGTFLMNRNEVENDTVVQKIFCGKCNSDTLIGVWTSSSWRFGRNCPKCGAQFKRANEYKYCIPVLIENGFICFEYYVSNEPEWFDYKDGKFVKVINDPEITVYQTIVFDKDHGFFEVSGQDALKRKTSYGAWEIESTLNRMKALGFAFDIEEAEIINMAAEYDRMSQERSANRKPSKREKQRDLYGMYEARVIDTASLTKELSVIYDTVNSNTWKCFCPVCGREWFYNGPEREQIKCECGNAIDGHYFARSRTNGEFIQFESTTLPGNELLVRRFYLEASFDGSYKGQTSVTERERIYFLSDEKGNVTATQLSASDGAGGSGSPKFIKKRSHEWYSRSNNKSCQDKALIKAEIEASCMNRSGLAEAIGLVDGYAGYFEPESIFAHPKDISAGCFETLAKSNMPGLTRAYFERTTCYEDRDKSIYDIFGIGKSVMRLCRKNTGIRLETARKLQNIVDLDPSATNEDLLRVAAMDRNNALADRMIFLIRDFGIKVSDQIGYLNAVYDHQCIENGDAMTTWIDYLRMAKACSFDLQDRTRRFPSSLRKEHDIAVFAYNKIKNEISEKMFAEQAEANKWLEYKNEEDGFMIIVPETPNDVISEATSQHNCLRSYLERIKNGETRVVFLRKIAEKDTSYVTIEVGAGNRIIQIKGFANSAVTDKATKNFIDKWMKRKHLER